MDPYISLGVYNHSESSEVPELGHIMYVARPSPFELDNLQGRAGRKVVDRHGVRHGSVRRSHRKISSNREIRSDEFVKRTHAVTR